ncbi:MAG: SpoIIE family protein phosphatase [Bacteroidales bacterium]|nr:SpoIIE family protein phosphatase [Bacteroidales bacterium]
MRKSVLLILFLLWFVNCVKAQLSDYDIYNYNEQDGLNSNQVTNVMVDDFGYVWLGFTSGLQRFDGQNFIDYSPNSRQKNHNKVWGNNVSDIKKDKNGNLWFASDKGISKYVLSEGRFYFYDFLVNGKILNSYRSDNIIFIGDKILSFSQNDMLFQLDENDNIFRPIIEDTFKKIKIKNVYSDSQGRLWCISEESNKIIVTDVRGNHHRTIECSQFGYKTLTRGNFAMFEAKNENFIFGGYNGIYVYHYYSKTFSKIYNDVKEFADIKDVKCFYEDSKERLWIGTNGQGLYCYDSKTNIISSYFTAQGQYNNNYYLGTVNCITEDKNGIIWFATWPGLTYVVPHNNNNFSNTTVNNNPDFESRNNISAINSYKNIFAIGTDGNGILFYDKYKKELLSIIDPALNNTKVESGSVLAICFDQEGNCYTGGYHRSLSKISPDLKKETIYWYNANKEDCMNNNYTNDIICDKKNRIWVTTNGAGFYQFNQTTGKFKRIQSDKFGNMLCSKSCTNLAELPNGSIFIGSYNGFSIYYPEDNLIENYSHNEEDTLSLSNDWVFDVCIDRKNRIWIATGAGLNLFDQFNKTFKQFSYSEGFVQNAIHSILEDKRTGYLWIATTKGIVKFDPEQQKVLRTYFVTDGLVSDNFLRHSRFIDKDGTMYFGASNGYVSFLPSQIAKDPKPSIPTIQGILLNYEEIQPGENSSLINKAPEAIQNIELSENFSTFSVKFSSINYVKGKNFTYSYSIIPNEWFDIKDRKEITISNLNPGNYTLIISCKNADNIESDYRQIYIKVLPKWYHTWWATVVFIFILITIIGFVFLSMKAQQKKLEYKVTLRTKEYQSVNNELTAQKEEISRQSKEISNQRDELISKNKELETNRKEIIKSNEEIKRALRNLMILNDFSKKISSSFDFSTIFITSYNYVQLIVEADIFTIGIYSQSTNSLEFRFCFIDYNSIQILPLPITSDYVEAQCYLSQKEEYLTGNKCNESFFYQSQKTIVNSYYIMPLCQDNKTKGIVCIGNKKQDFYNSNDLANLKMLSSYISIAIDKSRDYQMLRSKNNAINGSIRYAKTIQDAILVNESTINKYFDAAIIFNPKDIVSGDFYWYKTIENENQKTEIIFAAVIDCTGHGVPGALMSMISSMLLNEIVLRMHIYDPKTILSKLSKEVNNSLNQNEKHNNDGMDMALCRFDIDEKNHPYQMVYAGAKNSLYFYSSKNSKYEMIHADRVSIGDSNYLDHTFTNHSFNLTIGDIVYMTTDGFIDQNNKERKRFGRVKFINYLQEISNIEMKEQINILKNKLNSYMENEDQRDDITVMGLKII